MKPEAIELPATSFNRSKYSQPEDVLSPDRPDQIGIAALVAGDLPLPQTAPGGAIWEFFTYDDPTPATTNAPENNAHAEVRIKPINLSYDGKKPGSAAFKAVLRATLAAKMKVVKKP